jgi:hypothetical protein
MAAPAGAVFTFGIGPSFGSGNREDLLDVIINIDPWDAPLFTQSPKTTANHTTHEWLTDVLAATSIAGAIEGEDYGATTHTASSVRTRRSNVTQIFRKDFSVTNTQMAVNPAGVSDEYSYQVGKALKELARNVEVSSFVERTTATGGTAAARVMANLPTFITTGTGGFTTANGNGRHAGDSVFGGASTASSAPLTENIFNTELEIIFTGGGNPDSIYAPPKYKRRISSAFVGGTNGGARYAIAAADKKVINAVDVYDSDFGMVKIILDRWVPQVTSTAVSTASADQLGNIYFIETGMVRYAFLRPVKHVPLPPSGDASRGMVLGELTLEVGNHFALGRVNGLTGLVAA